MAVCRECRHAAAEIARRTGRTPRAVDVTDEEIYTWEMYAERCDDPDVCDICGGEV